MKKEKTPQFALTPVFSLVPCLFSVPCYPVYFLSKNLQSHPNVSLFSLHVISPGFYLPLEL